MDVGRPVLPVGEVEERGTRGRLVVAGLLLEARLRQLVPGQGLHHELVVGHVLVEGPDQVVPVAVDIRHGVVRLEGLGLRETHHVHPVPRPALAEVGRGKEPIDHLLVRLRRIIGEEGGQLLLGRGEPGERQRHPAQKVLLPRHRRGLPSLLLDLGEKEAVHLVDRPAPVPDLRHLHLGHRLHRPPHLALLEIELVLQDLLPDRLRARIGCAALHPLAQVGHLFRGQGGLGRHGVEVRIALDHPDQDALLRLARHDDRSAVASLHPAGLAVEEQAALDLLRIRRMALVALLREDRTNLRLEEGEVRRRQVFRGRWRNQRSAQAQREK